MKSIGIAKCVVLECVIYQYIAKPLQLSMRKEVRCNRNGEQCCVCHPIIVSLLFIASNLTLNTIESKIYLTLIYCNHLSTH